MNEDNKFLIPGAIIAAGLVIAIAVIYSVGGVGGNKPRGTATVAPTAGELPKVSPEDFVLGDQNAPVTIVEYGDYQCPFCGKFFKETEPALRENYIKTGKVKFVYRDFAFLGQESLWAANAAQCAGEKGKFWEYHDYLYGNQNGENKGAFSKSNLKNFGAVSGLVKDQFDSCVDSDKYLSKIKEETRIGGEAGVQGTPANFINGKIYVGALPSGTFTQIIDAELSK